MRIETAAILFASIAVLVVPPASAQEVSDHTVAIAGFSYLPGQDGVLGLERGALPVTLTVREGESIGAVNLDPPVIDPHTITSLDVPHFDTGNIGTGETAVIDTTGLAPGDYPFFCRNHPTTMFGVLRVEPAAEASGD